MFRHELSPFLLRVLDAVDQLPRGVAADAAGQPDSAQLEELAAALGETPDAVHSALLGLQAVHCLVEHVMEFEGIEPIGWWTVHPQCRPEATGGARHDQANEGA